MAYDIQYLGRNLNGRTQKAVQDFSAEMTLVLSNAAGAGALNSSRVYVQFWQKGLAVLERELREAIHFAYNLTGENGGEVLNQVAYCGNQMAERMMQAVRERSGRGGGSATAYAEVINKMQTDMTEKKDGLVDDFKHGMMGNEKLQKDPVVSIIANQTGSPGAVQQIGIGDFSQTAFVQNHQPLIDAINKALSSPEFAELPPEQREGFKDVADTLLDEAKKSNPDPGKLKRWGSRLGELALQLGLHVAAGEIVHSIGNMFT